jgi:Fur family peroxide stress response transcriptional regulator
MQAHTTPHKNERLRDIIDKMRQEGCRITPQRRGVLQILTQSEDHLTADEIYEQLKADFPTTSLATVYKTLGLLKTMGEVLELSFGEGSKRYDAHQPSPHPHLVCVDCGEITDIIDLELEGVDDLVGQVKARTKFKMLSYRIDFFGICQKCQRSKQEK